MNWSAKVWCPWYGRIVGRPAILSAVILASGCVIGAASASLAARQSTAFAPADSTRPVEELGSAIAERMRDRLQLTDAQVDAMRTALEERLRLIAALRAELGQRMAAEQGTLDMEIRGVLTEEQYGKWRQILDEARASRRQRGAGRFGRGG